MKKRIIYMILLLAFPLVVYADSVSLECPDEVEPNSEFDCEIIGNSDNKITDVDLLVTTSGNITFLSFRAASKWQGDGANGKITLYSDSNFTGEFKIGTLKLKALEDETNTVTIEQGSFFENRKQITLNPVSEIVRVKKEEVVTSDTNPKDTTNDNKTNNQNTDNKNDDDNQTVDVSSNNLIDIVIENYAIEFDTTVNEYNLTIGDEDSLVINPILEDNRSTVEVLGNENLKDGSVISVVVTDTDGGTNTYTISIKKEAHKGKNKYSLIFAIIIGVLVIINVVRIVANSSKKKENGES